MPKIREEEVKSAAFEIAVDALFQVHKLLDRLVDGLQSSGIYLPIKSRANLFLESFVYVASFISTHFASQLDSAEQRTFISEMHNNLTRHLSISLKSDEDPDSWEEIVQRDFEQTLAVRSEQYQQFRRRLDIRLLRTIGFAHYMDEGFLDSVFGAAVGEELSPLLKTHLKGYVNQLMNTVRGITASASKLAL